jgi:hypothetical protein
MVNSGIYRSAGTALVCFSLLVYELFSARLLSVVVEGQMAIFAIAFAMLGMGAATSIMSVTNWPRSGTNRDESLSRLAMILGLAYPLCLMLVAAASEQTNTILEAAMTAGGFHGLIDTIRENFLTQMIWVGSILFVPYFVFGIFIAALFKSCKQNDYPAFYAADLIGASLGCVFFVIVMDSLDYAGGIFLIILPTLLGATAFAGAHSRRATTLPALLAGAVCAATLIPGAVSFLEPRPALNQLARNYDQQYDVVQNWHVWNAHSRVAQLTLSDRETGETGSVYAHEAGAGWAIIPRTRAEVNAVADAGLSRSLHGPAQWSRLAAAFKPKRVLVLFAGVGSDMASIYEECGGSCEIIGVEINGHMVDHALSGGFPSVTELIGKPGVTLVTAEAREYLGRDTGKYDAILLSWWGAGTSYYLGTSGQLAQYLYTVEAFDTLLDHLTPEGILILFNGNKAQTLLNFRQVFRQRNRGTMDGKFVIVTPASQGPDESSHMEPVDTKRMIVKPSGFRDGELARLQRMAESFELRTIFSPDGVDPRYQIYQDIVDGKSADDINKALIEEYDAALSIIEDSRPFLGHFIPNSYYLDLSRWLRTDIKSPQWIFVQFYIFFILFLTIVSIVIVMGPLLLKSGPTMNTRNMVNLFYFLSLGAGFILIEIAFVRKFGLILGHPSYAIAVVLAALILSTGLGSLGTQRLFGTTGITEKQVALGVVLYAVIGGAAYDQMLGAIIAFPIPVKAALVILALFPLGFLMGQLFPQGLMRVSRDDARLVPWAWAINATASTVGVGIADLISRPLGYNAVLYIGAAFYAGIILLPLYARQPRLAPA